MTQKAVLTLEGQSIDPKRFLDDAGDFLTLHREAAAHIARSDQEIHWEIADLRKSSAVFAINAQGPEKVIEEVFTTIVDGLILLEQKARRPHRFTDRMLEIARSLGLRATKNDPGTVISVGTPPDERRVKLTAKLIANVDEILGPRIETIGAVEGTIELVSMHGSDYFNIYEPIHNTRIKCWCSETLLAEARTAGFGRRVLVSGDISYNQQRQPYQIKATQIRVFGDEDDLPKLEDIFGMWAHDVSLDEINDSLAEGWDA